MTDGSWLWRLDFPHYLETHHVSLPGAFIEHVRSVLAHQVGLALAVRSQDFQLLGLLMNATFFSRPAVDQIDSGRRASFSNATDAAQVAASLQACRVPSSAAACTGVGSSFTRTTSFTISEPIRLNEDPPHVRPRPTPTSDTCSGPPPRTPP
ncbi:hypothetical protein ACIHCV_45670 [Streptomyces sp. NPDC051956]|uniref:hypothetical protein n=1 Tax=Streptomyces sp. NPDC051956 TaxID=3365677 RepID=UPI0037D1D738